MLPLHITAISGVSKICCLATAKPSLRRGSTFTFRSPQASDSNEPRGAQGNPSVHTLRRTISVPVTSTSRDTAPLAFHAKVQGASRAAVAGEILLSLAALG